MSKLWKCTILCLLVALLPVIPVGAHAKNGLEIVPEIWHKKAFDESWTQPELSKDAPISPEDALRIAAEAMLRLEFATADTLAEFAPCFYFPSPDFWDGRWIVSLMPNQASQKTEPYWLEIAAYDGHLMSVSRGRNTYDLGMAQQGSNEPVYRRVVEAPVDADSIPSLIEQWVRSINRTTLEEPPKSKDGGMYVEPSNGDVKQEEAIATVIEEILSHYGISIEMLHDYRPVSALVENSGRRVWIFRLYPINLMSENYYIAEIDARSNEILTLASIDPKDPVQCGLTSEAKLADLLEFWETKATRPLQPQREGGINAIPKADDVQWDTALRLALDRFLGVYPLPMEALYAFGLSVDFYMMGPYTALDSVGPNQRAWCFYISRFDTNSVPGLIRAVVESSSGEVTHISCYYSQDVQPTIPIMSAEQQDTDTQLLIDVWEQAFNEAMYTPQSVTFEQDQFYLSGGYQQIDIDISPSQNDLWAKDALGIAVAALTRFTGQSAEAFAEFNPVFRFYSTATRNLWVIHFEGAYAVEVASPSGFLLRIQKEITDKRI